MLFFSPGLRLSLGCKEVAVGLAGGGRQVTCFIPQLAKVGIPETVKISWFK